MAKGRKRIFPKPPEKLTTRNAHLLGKNSNKVCPEATMAAIYNQPTKDRKVELTKEQERMLANLKKNLSSSYQR